MANTIKTYHLSNLTYTELNSLKSRPRIDFTSIFNVVNPIVDDVHNQGDAAVKQYTSRFDKVDLDKIVELVSDLPDPLLDPSIKEAFDVAYSNIYAFHAAQKSPEKSVENMKGVQCKRVARSINFVGLYVPGGTAVLPSTTLMLAVPAQIAGCKTIVLENPPTQDGSTCKEVLYCAKKTGVTHILKAGGAQAISAMAWGTETCPKVEKIFGPGNQYVTAAKTILQNLKKDVASGKLAKVKASFKLSLAAKKPVIAKPKTKPAAKAKKAVKAKTTAKPKAKAVVKPNVVSKAKPITHLLSRTTYLLPATALSAINLFKQSAPTTTAIRNFQNSLSSSPIIQTQNKITNSHALSSAVYGKGDKLFHAKSGPLNFHSSLVSRGAQLAVDYDDDAQHDEGDEGLKIAKIGISKEIVNALAKKGITKLFPIQKAVLEPAMQGRDMIGRARNKGKRKWWMCLDGKVKEAKTSMGRRCWYSGWVSNLCCCLLSMAYI